MTDRPDQHRLDELAAPTTPDPDLVGVLTELFADYRATRATPTAVVDLDRGLWQRLEDLGLTRLTGSESAGGSGGGWVDAAALLGLAAAAAAPVPLAEHDVLGGWLLEAAGLPNDGGLRTVCRPDPSGVALNVTWARDASRIVALWEDRDQWRVADVPVDRVGHRGAPQPRRRAQRHGRVRPRRPRGRHRRRRTRSASSSTCAAPSPGRRRSSARWSGSSRSS